MPPHVESLSNHDDDVVIHPSPSTVDDDGMDAPPSNNPNANSNANPQQTNALSSGAMAFQQSLEQSPLFRDEDELIRTNHGGAALRCRLDRRQSDVDFASSNGNDDGDAGFDEDPAGRKNARDAAPPVFVSKISQIIGPESKYIKSAPSTPPPSSSSSAAAAPTKDSCADSLETASPSAAVATRIEQTTADAFVTNTGQQSQVSSFGTTTLNSCSRENSKNKTENGEEKSQAEETNEAPEFINSAAATNSESEENRNDDCGDHVDETINIMRNCTVEFLTLPPQLVLRATKNVSKRGWKVLKFIGGSGTRLVGAVFTTGVGAGRSEC